MKLNISVEDVNLSSVIGEHLVPDGDGAYIPEEQTLGQAIAEEITRKLTKTDRWDSAQEMVRRVREEEVRTAVQAEIANALTQPVHPTNTWGESTGPATTLRQKINDMVQTALAQKGNSYGSGKSVVETVIYEQVNIALRKELSAAIEAEKKKVVAAVRAKAADLIANAVKDGIG